MSDLYAAQASQTATLADVSSTAATAVLTAKGNGSAVVGVNVSNKTSSAVTVTLDYYDGSSAVSLCTGYSVQANNPLSWTFPSPFRLRNGESIRVLSGTSSALDVTLFYYNLPARDQAGENATTERSLPGPFFGAER